MSPARPCRIAITPGEPAGIGPDLVLDLLGQLHHTPHAPTAIETVVIADPALLQQRAARLKHPLQLQTWLPQSATPANPDALQIAPVTLAAPCEPGRLDPANARYVLQCLDRAIDGCLRGEFDALVTGPVHKGVINDAGIPFSGHTEYLAERSHSDQVVMMLAAPGLRVALATTHLALREVADAITRPLLMRVLEVLDRDLRRYFALPAPRILVCGLNPHAGEQGHLGREELDIIQPALDALRAHGLNLIGPLPADTLFTPPQLARGDAVLAMYHDQGLPVLKHLGFGEAVNITLGLPFIRTSVDHGTALELAGSGAAHSSSLLQAIRTAQFMHQAMQAGQPTPV